MEASTPCSLRYIYKGRTFCAIAIRDRRYTTTEVIPRACADCQARRLMATSQCDHLDLGVEVDLYGGAHTVSVFYASCRKLVERIADPERCGEEQCPHWTPVDVDKLEAVRQEALEAQRENEGVGLD